MLNFVNSKVIVNDAKTSCTHAPWQRSYSILLFSSKYLTSLERTLQSKSSRCLHYFLGTLGLSLFFISTVMQSLQLAFIHSVPPLLARVHPWRSTCPIASPWRHGLPAPCRRIARLHPSARARQPPPQHPSHSPEPSGKQRQTDEASPSAMRASRTFIGRILVEILSLMIGALLLVVVLFWRFSQVISYNAIRAFAWISNVRRLGKWAFTRLARADKVAVPVTSFAHTLRRVYSYAFTRGYDDDDDVLIKDHPHVVDTTSHTEASSSPGANATSTTETPGFHDDDDEVIDGQSHFSNAATQKRTRTVLGRRLILLRHAKTLWNPDSASADHERQLSGRGKEEARLVGAELSRLDWLPDAVLASDAVRTVQTLRLLNLPDDVTNSATCTDSLYFAVTGDEMAVAVDDALRHSGFPDHSTLLVVCHNPGCEELVEQLTGKRPDMGTGCAALLQYNTTSKNRIQHGPELGKIVDEDRGFSIAPDHRILRWSLVELIRPSTLTTVRTWGDG